MLDCLGLPESLEFAADGETSFDSAVSVATRSVAVVLETVAFQHCSLMQSLLLLRPIPWRLGQYYDDAMIAVGYVVDQPNNNEEKTKKWK